MEGKHADLGTFVIRVKQCQNDSWQGEIKWVDEDKTTNFRSTWEMLRLIGSAVETEESAQRLRNLTWDEDDE